VRPGTITTTEGGTINTKVIDGVVHVWSIFDNAWVTLDYWNRVNGRG
jgi:hypothetical protein